jgi:hypothetical protein
VADQVTQVGGVLQALCAACPTDLGLWRPCVIWFLFLQCSSWGALYVQRAFFFSRRAKPNFLKSHLTGLLSTLIGTRAKRKPPYNNFGENSRTHTHDSVSQVHSRFLCSDNTHHRVPHISLCGTHLSHSTRPSTPSTAAAAPLPLVTTSTAANACSRARSPAHRAHRS